MPSPLYSRLRHQFSSSRTDLLSLVTGLNSHETRIQVDDLRGPLIWDLGHAAWFEELWILRNTFGESPSRPESDQMYDNERNHKRTRQTMRLYEGDDLHTYRERIRTCTLQRLEETSFPEDNPLLRNGFVFDLVLHHELQHREIMMVTLQQLLASPHPILKAKNNLSVDSLAAEAWQPGAMVEIPEGEFEFGDGGEVFAYDNERPVRKMKLKSFAIDRFKTSNGEYVEFIEAGGYRKREYWTEEGWTWIQLHEISAPEYWRLDPKEGWMRKNFGGRIAPLALDEPVINISAHEAQAYAAFRGKRLPTEEEWEKAASWDPKTEARRRFPWGNKEATPQQANLDSWFLGPTPVWAHGAGDTATGLRQMTGNAWEWTSSSFQPYPGFRAFPYAEYSEIFMGSRLKVLRGASWATSPWVIRNTFRNFYLPHHRNVIGGIRCAKNF